MSSNITASAPANCMDILATHQPMCGLLSGYTSEEVEIFRRFPAYQGPGTKGFITDFLGVRTSTDFVSTVRHLDGTVMGYPVPSCWHAIALEYIAALRAVLEATESFCVVELGAGWGPWIVTSGAAAKQIGIGSLRLVAVEADSAHCGMIRSHVQENGLSNVTEIVRAAVTGKDGTARFPIITDPASGYGASVDTQGACGYVSVPAYTISTLLREIESVDFLHIDIQGTELEAIRASLDVMQAKVRRMFVGTHSRRIEVELSEEMAAAGWILENEQPCIFQTSEDGERSLYMDGCQVYRNTKLTPLPKTMPEKIAHLVDRIEAENLRLAIYAAGEHTDMLYETTALSRIQPVAFFDRDSAKQLSGYRGAQVFAPFDPSAPEFDILLISSKAHHREIYRDIKGKYADNVEILDPYRSPLGAKGTEQNHQQKGDEIASDPNKTAQSGIMRDVCQRLTALETAWKNEIPALLETVSRLNHRQLQTNIAAEDPELRTSVQYLLGRIEFVRRELMYETRHAGKPSAQNSSVLEVQTRILNPEKLADARCRTLRLNLGCGHIPLPEYLNVDRREIPGVDILSESDRLPFAPSEVDEISSAHFLEHFPQEELRRTLLPYWHALLKPGGLFRAVVPDGKAMIGEFSQGRFAYKDLHEALYGAQEYQGDFHYTLFTPQHLTELLLEAGFCDVTLFEEGRRNGGCYEFEIHARKNLRATEDITA
jgi:FkbM family methyltransferase